MAVPPILRLAALSLVALVAIWSAAGEFRALAVGIAVLALSGVFLVFAAAHSRLRRQVEARQRAEAELAGKVQALHAANSRLERILETAGEGIYGIDADNLVTFANRGAAELLEWPSPDAMVGRPGPLALGHLLADGRPCTQGDCAIRRTLKDGVQRLVADEFFVTGAGRRLPVEYVVSAQTIGGHVAGCVVVFRDVGQRRLAEQALKERQELFEQVFTSGSAIKLLIDPVDGAIVDANLAAAEFYGYSLAELRAMTIHQINALPRDEVRRRMDQAAVNQSNYFVAPHRTAGGEVREVEVYSGPIRAQQDRILLMSIIHDVSERMRSERDLQAAHQRLEEQARELERSNADLEQFAYVASHDLREPLRMVSNFLSLVERRTGDKLDAETREFIEFAVDGAKRMDRLILDLLQYSRIGRLSQPMRRVAVAEAVGLALGNLRLAIEESGAEIAVAPDLPELVASEDDLARLFQNLVGNALKYRSPDRAPRIELGCGRDGDTWRFSVTDNGIGINPANLDRVFGIFKRLHAMGEYEGTGIGLAICRKIVERHGGRIWAESAGEGEGCAFCFTLPAN